jgi:predicted  nucleic acid-binding Zn-ribbon protein
MPHQCTNCGRAFDDGSKEMLSGCPDCGGNKFQFHPSEADVPDDPEPDAEPPDPPTPDSSVARTVGTAAATVRDIVGSGSGDSPGPDEAPSAAGDSGAPGEGGANAATGADASSPAPMEDAAQADARSQVVSPDEIPASDNWEPADAMAGGTDDSRAGGLADAEDPVETAEEDRPDLQELREELNDQFESIKVLKPGHYELNLMELYDREEYIIALQEDGRYTIQVPETWHE